ncbi:MAG: PEP/pyruvate-binding domain-containing protein [Crocinitomicaceae bacterium]
MKLYKAIKHNCRLKAVMFTVLCTFGMFFSYSQGLEVPILNYSTDINGQVQLEVNSSANNYYILKVRHHVDSAFERPVSMTIGSNGTTFIGESLKAYPEENYQVLEYSIAVPDDTDGDGIDDITEFNNIPNDNPLNFAESIDSDDGGVVITDAERFIELALKKDKIAFSPYLDGKEFTKFIFLDFFSSNPKLFFINTNKYPLHLNFAEFMNVDHLGADVVKGQIVFHPTVLSNNGTLGSYAFNFTNNEWKNFEITQKVHELIGASMLFLENNLSFYINEVNEPAYLNDLEKIENSRVPVLFETDVYAGLNYWGLNQTEGYGILRLASETGLPSAKDIMLYESIPNSLPRVAGIITSVIQTPLSHVNLRAIQDNIPNAFIRDPLDSDTIADLINEYIYYNVEQSNYTIRKSTFEEANAWFDQIRPQNQSVPPLNLDYRSILTLDEITFDMYDGFGAKCTNVATMRTFGFMDGTIPDGFGIPFYYYQEFMKYNNLFELIDKMISDPEFIADRTIRESSLEELRLTIKNSRMPEWMWLELGEMQRSFKGGASIRVRSSTNNEDLPGFSGAGLYNSKTQHPLEGHIAKSIKQVYASLWNLRAFEEREFFRIDHFTASMGILCHLNYADELVNGVGVSADPIYNTTDSYYLNTQLGDNLITNPEGSRPEEILLNKVKTEEDNYSIIQYSSIIDHDSLLMSQEHLDELRDYLTVIHESFEKLYNAEGNSTFAMDIEYKVTKNNSLVIKQARPWVSYSPQNDGLAKVDVCSPLLFPNPATEFINVTCKECNLTTLRIVNLNGQFVDQKDVSNSNSSNAHFNIDHLPSGVYFISAYRNNSLCNTTKFIKR